MSVNDPMMESKHHDPMLDGITRYSVRNDYLTSRAAVGDEPFKGSTDAVLFSDLPALLSAAREDEREKHVADWDRATFDAHAYAKGQRDERERCIGEIRDWCKDNPRLCGECGAAIAALRGET